MLSPASQTETQTIMMVLTEKMENTTTRKKHTQTRQMDSLFSNIKEKGHSTKERRKEKEILFTSTSDKTVQIHINI
jgi:hypothetical protein